MSLRAPCPRRHGFLKATSGERGGTFTLNKLICLYTSTPSGGASGACNGVWGTAPRGFTTNGAVKMSRPTTRETACGERGKRIQPVMFTCQEMKCSRVSDCSSCFLLVPAQGPAPMPDDPANPMTLACPTILSSLACEDRAAMTPQSQALQTASSVFPLFNL